MEGCRAIGVNFSRVCSLIFCFFLNDTATTEIYTLSLHDALPIWPHRLPTSFFPSLLERFPRHDKTRLGRGRPKFASIADARNGNELIATENQRQAGAAPRRNAPLLEQILQRATWPAGVQPQTLPALPQAHGDASRAQFRDTQTPSFFGLEL